ncbi:MAG TPA: hypothetical protein VN861_03540 [Candidatus Acidoferrales bacterium]|nr:hypothetical protein [Candidatus Acidoferrales bacterium]
MAERKNKPDECESCHYDTDALTMYDHGMESNGVHKELWLCELCASSLAGNAARYYSLYSGDVRMITGCIMNAANHILAELRKRAGGPDES